MSSGPTVATPLPSTGFTFFSFILSVLRDYLGGAHLTMRAMDMACSPSVRATFLDILQHPFFILGDNFGLATKQKVLNYMCWINSRHVRLLKLKVQVVSVVALSAAHPNALEKVEEIDLDGCPDDSSHLLKLEDAFYQVFTKCVALKCIRAKDVRMMMSAFEQLKKCPQLPVASISCAMFGSYVNQVIDVFHRTLEELEVTFVEQGAHLPEITDKWKRLKKLALVNCDVSVQDINTILDFLPLLVDFEFREGNFFQMEPKFTVQDIATIAPRFRHLLATFVLTLCRWCAWLEGLSGHYVGMPCNAGI